MPYKPGRNDPCLCGSGKKYKHCCLKTVEEPSAEKGHARAVKRAIAWLMDRHRKTVSDAIGEMLFAGLTDAEHDALENLDEQTWQVIQINATEWLLAEGQIQVEGEPRRVSDLLLDRGGPVFTVDQRRWIEQLCKRPLRVYDVTEVVPGQQMTLCDALDLDAAPVIVQEKSGSQESLIGTQFGVRIMAVDSHYELSGAAYPFSHMAGPSVVALMREAMDHFDKPREDLPEFFSFLIRHKWLEQYLKPMPLPTIVDAYSGEPMLLITDRYRVKDWGALAQTLAAQDDVQGGRKSGWDRLIDCDDGQTRSAVTINIGKSTDQIELFYKTQGYADRGRPWFEGLAGEAVEFGGRVLSDPKGIISNMPSGQVEKRGVNVTGLPPEALAEAIEKAIHRTHADWADEPLQALGGKTPRQAIGTPVGLERVKGLLRSYEASERQQAAQQERREISYSFLWDALGISP
jgi:SEC-C motif